RPSTEARLRPRRRRRDAGRGAGHHLLRRAVRVGGTGTSASADAPDREAVLAGAACRDAGRDALGIEGQLARPPEGGLYFSFTVTDIPSDPGRTIDVAMAGLSAIAARKSFISDCLFTTLCARKSPRGVTRGNTRSKNFL